MPARPPFASDPQRNPVRAAWSSKLRQTTRAIATKRSSGMGAVAVLGCLPSRVPVYGQLRRVRLFRVLGRKEAPPLPTTPLSALGGLTQRPPDRVVLRSHSDSRRDGYRIRPSTLDRTPGEGSQPPRFRAE